MSSAIEELLPFDCLRFVKSHIIFVGDINSNLLVLSSIDSSFSLPQNSFLS